MPIFHCEEGQRRHANVKTSRDVYMQVMPEQQREAVERFATVVEIKKSEYRPSARGFRSRDLQLGRSAMHGLNCFARGVFRRRTRLKRFLEFV
jgi:hypothetical protein